MNQTFFTATDGNERAKVNDTGHFTCIDAAHFDFCSDFFDATDREFRFLAVGCCDLHSTVIFDFDGGAGLFGQRTDYGTALTDNIFDLVWIDLDGVNTRCEFRDITAWCVDSLFHHAQDVQTCTFSLVQRNLHDLFGDTFNFDIHLQRRDTVAGTRHFEVHIAEVIFVAQNVRQNNIVVAFFHQAHCDTRNGGFDWHACIHQRQRGTAHGSHGRRTVGFGDFRHHTYGVREFVCFWHDCQHAALRQTTVTNFTTLR